MVQAICKVGEDNRFSNINIISELSQKKMETWKVIVIHWFMGDF
jgi:hypothetical protein